MTIRIISRLLLVATISGASIYAANADTAESSGVQKLTVLHTNDHHGHFWANKYGEIGMAARKTLIDRIRKEVKQEGGELLLLSGGDINTGVPESDMQNAQPDFMGMNMIGYDAMALGNHEFDNSMEILRQQQQWADFPFLAANIYDGSGQLLFTPYTIFQLGDLSIGVIGLTTEDTALIGNPEHIGNVRFTSPVEAANKAVRELKDKTDIIIAATHMGHYQNGENGINAPGDVNLARKVNDLDIIVGGHSQDPLFKPDRQNGTLILQAHEWGKYVGRADLELQNGQLELISYQLIPVNLKKKIKTADGQKKRVHIAEPIAEDPLVLAQLQPYQNNGQALLQQKIGTADNRLMGERSEVRFGDTNLGRLIATAQQQKVGADLVVLNSGGIRSSIDEGDITYKDILTVHPFGNTLVYTDMTGQEILDYLSVVASKPVDSGAFAHYAGLELVISNGQLNEVKVNGKAVDKNDTYRLATNSFTASGGDGYPKIDQHPGFIDTGFVDADVLKAYIKLIGSIKTDDYVPVGIVRK